MASEISEITDVSTASDIYSIDSSKGQEIRPSLDSIGDSLRTPQRQTSITAGPTDTTNNKRRVDISHNNFDLPSGINNTPFDSFDPVSNILDSISRLPRMSISPQKSVSPEANSSMKSPLRRELYEEVTNGPSDIQQFSTIDDRSIHTGSSSVVSKEVGRDQTGNDVEIPASPQFNPAVYHRHGPHSRLFPTSTHSTPGRRIIDFDNIPQEEKLKTIPRSLDRKNENFTNASDTSIFNTEESRSVISDAIGSSPMEIPKLLTSVKPWENSQKLRSSVESSHRTTAPNTPNMFTVTNSGNGKGYSGANEEFGLLAAAPTGSPSSEVQYLRKKLQAYQIRVNALNEIIKQANLGNAGVSSSGSGSGSTVNNNGNVESSGRNNNLDIGDGIESRQVIHSDRVDKRNDDQTKVIYELKNVVAGLNREITAKNRKIDELNDVVKGLRSELEEAKDEYVKTLNYADEYVKQSDAMAESVDRLLIYLTEVHFKNYQIPEQEIEILKKARDIGSNFIAVKMNALETSLTNLLQNLQRNEKDIPFSLPNITVDGNILANSTQLERTENEFVPTDKPDSKLEATMENLCAKCDGFISNIKGKLVESSNMEQLLLAKLLQQQKLIEEIFQCHNDRLRSEDKDWSNLYKRSSVLSNFDDLNRKANINLSKSYQEHIDSLNSLIETLKRNILERDEELTRLKDLSRRDEASERKHRSLLMEINSLKEMSKFKEDNWNTLAYQLEVQINEITSKNESLEKLISELNNELKDVRESKKSLSDQSRLNKKDIESYLSQIQQLKSSNESLQNLILTLKTKQVSKLNINELEFKKFSQNLLLHLTNTFQILKKIIQRSSINQSMKKIQTISTLVSLSNLKAVGPKFEVLYNFIEMALESIIESYTNLLLEQSASSTSPSANSEPLDSDSKREMQFRIEELQKRWVAERERRKLDTDAAETVISKLETENKVLKDQLFNLSIRG